MSNEKVNKIRGAAKEAAEGEGENGEKAHKVGGNVRPHPGPVASQARHQLVAPQETCAPRNVVPEEREKAPDAQGCAEALESVSAGDGSGDVENLKLEISDGSPPPYVGGYEEQPKKIGKVKFRPYQKEIFLDHRTGIVVLHWSRQIGKSYALAAWAIWRLLDKPGRLITVLSNSRENGAEFLKKCAEICALNETPIDEVVSSPPTLDYEDMRMELRMRVEGKVSRIKVLAANPRTARGFSGDLILDEFAFHEDGNAIWEAAEPILASNRDFLCRIASTGNGKHNLFYRMVEGGVESSNDQEQMTRPRGNDECLMTNDKEEVSSVQFSVFSKEEAPLPGPPPTTASRGEGDASAAGCLTHVADATAAGSAGVAAAGSGDTGALPGDNGAAQQRGPTGEVALGGDFYVEEYRGGCRKVFMPPRPEREKLELKMTYSEDGGPRYEIVPPSRGRYGAASPAEQIQNEKLRIKNGEAKPNTEHRTSNAEHRIEDGEHLSPALVPTTASRGEGGVPVVGSLTGGEDAAAAGLVGVAAAETAALRDGEDYVEHEHDSKTGEISEPSDGRVAQRAYRRAHSVEAVESLI